MGKQPSKPGPENMEIAPGYTVADWKRLILIDENSLDWPKAVDIFETTMKPSRPRYPPTWQNYRKSAIKRELRRNFVTKMNAIAGIKG